MLPFTRDTAALAHPRAAGLPGTNPLLGRAGTEGRCLVAVAAGDERLPRSAVLSFEGSLTGCRALPAALTARRRDTPPPRHHHVLITASPSLQSARRAQEGSHAASCPTAPVLPPHGPTSPAPQGPGPLGSPAPAGDSSVQHGVPRYPCGPERHWQELMAPQAWHYPASVGKGPSPRAVVTRGTGGPSRDLG